MISIIFIESEREMKKKEIDSPSGLHMKRKESREPNTKDVCSGF